MKATKTQRGFALNNFIDLYGAECSLQKSSLAFEDAIWLGVNNVTPTIMHRDAKRLGIRTDATCGHVDYPLPKEVHLSTRMHLSREQVAELIPVLQKFVDTGEI